MSAAHAIETQRGIVIELQMAPIRHEVNIAMEPHLGLVQSGRSLNDYGYLVQSREAMFDHLLWWGEAFEICQTKDGRPERLCGVKLRASGSPCETTH